MTGARAAQLRRAPGWWNLATSGRSLEAARAVVPRFLEQIPGSWSAGPGSWTSTGTAVVPLSGPEGEAILRLRRVGVAALARESQVLAALAELPLPDRVRALLPSRLAQLSVDGWSGVADRAFPGAALSSGESRWDGVRPQALDLADALHRSAEQEVVVDDRLLELWVDRHVAVLRRTLLPGAETALRRVRRLLHDGLRDRRLRVTWVHGDFWAGNLLADGTTLTGLVDWDLAAPEELPVHDYLQLLLHDRQVRERSELGAVVAALLTGRPWSPQEQEVLDRLRWPFADADLPDRRVLLLLHWLRYAAAMTRRPYTTYSPRVWELRNVRPVLRAVSSGSET